MRTPLEHLTSALTDRYRIERELGRGGMATVYLAISDRLFGGPIILLRWHAQLRRSAQRVGQAAP